MNNSLTKEKVYEVQFEQLDKFKEVEIIENKKVLLNAQLELKVTMGGCKKSIKDVLELKNGDVITLDKFIDDDLDINLNNEMIAKGESVILDNKLGVRLTKFGNSIE